MVEGQRIRNRISRKISCCLISLFYIKPQLPDYNPATMEVVLYPYSTSNHNTLARLVCLLKLSYILILHQTTTATIEDLKSSSCFISLFYIKPQLVTSFPFYRSRCFISLFYIKPQHNSYTLVPISVVLYPYSTSNHNYQGKGIRLVHVVLYPYSTSNHNLLGMTAHFGRLFYILILHQTTTSYRGTIKKR